MKKMLKRIGLIAGVAVFGVLLNLGREYIGGNFHEVIPGELYRSAQLNPGDLTRYRQEYHIASVINLRGENEQFEWYRDEVKESAEAGVKHIDFRMSASHELSPTEALALIQTMRDAPKPLLVHCRSGADRTGLASAFYMASIAKQTEWASERQMWIVYGHIPFAISAAVAMNRTFERMEPYFGFHDT